MNERTAKAIKDILDALQRHAYIGDSQTLSWMGEERLEKALCEFAEGIKLDAIEP